MTSPAPQAVLPAREHHLPAAAVAVVGVGLLVALPELLGGLGRLAAVIVLQLGLVLAWVLVTGIQGFAGSLAVGAAGAVVADLALVLPESPALGELLVVFGVGFLAAVLQQMLRRSREDLVASLSGVVLLLTAVGSLAGLLLLGRTSAGHDRALVALLAVGAALVVGHLIDAVLPRPQLAPDVPRGLLGLVAAVLAGAAVAFLGRSAGSPVGAEVALLYGAVLGGVAALVALAGSYIAVEAGRAEGGEPPSPWAAAVIQSVL
ncbi:MAG: hypothetical protein ABWY29_12875, partial [Blastococcus sp.]